MLSRRGFLIGGAATVLGASSGLWAVERGHLPGKIALGRAVGLCNVDATPPRVDAGPLTDGQFLSTYRKQTLSWTLARPPGPQPQNLPVALVRHGRADNARTAFDSLGLHRFLAEYVRKGGRPFALAAVDGGTAYWHPRASGDNPLGMLVHELLPRLGQAGLRTDRIAVLGWSMGGYGALLLARESRRDHLAGTEVVASAAASPALFPRYADSAPGAFDDRTDFATWGDLLADPGISSGTAMFASCGDHDPFTTATHRYRAEVHPKPAGAISRGCHTQGYWRSEAARQIAFLGAHLAA